MLSLQRQGSRLVAKLPGSPSSPPQARLSEATEAEHPLENDFLGTLLTTPLCRTTHVMSDFAALRYPGNPANPPVVSESRLTPRFPNALLLLFLKLLTLPQEKLIDPTANPSPVEKTPGNPANPPQAVEKALMLLTA